MKILSNTKHKKGIMKKYEIWLGRHGGASNGEHSSVRPEKIAEVEATSFKIACLIYEHQNAIDSLRLRMSRGERNIENDSHFGSWYYNPDNNSSMWTGRYYESESEAWKSFS